MYHCNWSHCKEQASVAWTENEYIFDKQLGSFFFYFAQFIYLKKKQFIKPERMERCLCLSRPRLAEGVRIYTVYPQLLLFFSTKELINKTTFIRWGELLKS